MSRESNHTLPLGAIAVGLLVFSLVTAAAGPSGPMGWLPGRAWPALAAIIKTAQPETGIGSHRAGRQVPPAARAQAKTVMTDAGASENRNGIAGTKDRQSALRTSRGVEESPGIRGVILFGNLSAGSVISILALLLCVVVLLGAASWTRKLSRAKEQLERRSLDLSSSNDELKREIGERRRAETAMRASENFYYSLVETVPQNIFRKDLKGHYTFVNRAFCATAGKSAAEITGKTDFDIFPAEVAAAFQREDEQVLSTGKQIEIEHNYPTPTRGKICVQVVRTPLFDSEGRPMGIQGIFWDVTERKRAKSELESVHRQLIEASRRVGMAEVATGVLHNVGNVLNSVNVSATVVCDQVQKSKVLSLGKVAALISEHADDEKFLIEDRRGKQLPGYLKDLAEHLRKERATIMSELNSLVKNIEHIKEIVVMQQTYAKLSGLCVAVKTSDIAEDALRMNSSALTRHEVEVVREYLDDPTIIVDKHQVLQTLVNLIRNAKYACDESGRSDKKIWLRICKNGNDRIRIQVLDNGVGIPAENMTRIFTRGFTTRADGHGFGLHSSRLAAQEMGGMLTAQSDGPGLGAVFTLDLPCQPEESLR